MNKAIAETYDLQLIFSYTTFIEGTVLKLINLWLRQKLKQTTKLMLKF